MSSMQKHSSCVFHDSPHDMKTFQSELEPCRSQTYSPALRIIFKKVKKPSSPAYQLLSKLLLVSKDFSLQNITTREPCHQIQDLKNYEFPQVS